MVPYYPIISHQDQWNHHPGLEGKGGASGDEDLAANSGEVPIQKQKTRYIMLHL